MSKFFWFALSLFASLIYYQAIKNRLQSLYDKHSEKSLLIVTFFTLGALIGLAISHYFGFLGQSNNQSLLLFLNFCLTSFMVFITLDLLLSSNHAGLRISMAIASMLLAIGLLFEPKSFNNIVLFIGSLGICSLLGYTLRKKLLLILIYSAIAIFDVFAVWYSNLMSTIFDYSANIVPIGFLEFMALPNTGSIGAGDVWLSIIGVIAINNLVNLKRAYITGIVYWISLLIISNLHAGYFASSNIFPCMILISPITISAVLIPQIKFKTTYI